MKSFTIISDVLITLMVSYISYFSLFSDHSFEQHVQSAELIITGQLIKKTSKNELVTKSFHNDNASFSVDSSVITTYVFAVNELLKGSYNKRYIEVKTLGGCDEMLGTCEDYHKSDDFILNQDVVLLLKYVEDNGAYQIDQAACSAFVVDGQGQLFSKASSKNGDKNIINPNTHTGFNIKALKSLIKMKVG